MSFEKLEIAISPCPNDTFVFGPLVLGWIKVPFRTEFRFEDIETLNRMALRGEVPVVKLSFALLPEVAERYLVLPVGAALGRGVGPLLVGRKPYTPEEVPKLKVLLPGEHTTAHLLFRLAFPGAERKIFVPYHEIIPGVLRDEAEAGVIIHEGRFVFRDYGLHQILDLGAWWEGETGLPLPLGGIFARRDLPPERLKALTSAIRQSLELAERHFDELYPFIAEKARELSREVIIRHLVTYVNEFTRDLGREGRKALEALAKKAKPEAQIFIWGEK